MPFQNGSNKVVITVVQFRSEIILVISNRTRAARSFNFEITRMISDQIALHSVQLPLFRKFSAPAIAFLAFWLAKKLRLWANSLSFTVLSCGNLKPHQLLEVKNIFKWLNVMLQLTFNPGLTLTGFRTTRSWALICIFVLWTNWQSKCSRIENRTSILHWKWIISPH